MSDNAARASTRDFARFAMLLSVVGIALQLLLSAYYLTVGHAPHPHDLPVGIVAEEPSLSDLTKRLEADGRFAVDRYENVDAMSAAIKRKQAYGGLDVSGVVPHLYVASAAGPSASNLMTTAFRSAVQEGRTAKVDQFVATGQLVQASTVRQLTNEPLVTDVVALPKEDPNGAAIGFLMQALALGGSIASAGLGRLLPRTRPSLRRGGGHVLTLVVYALGSAAAVVWVASMFGIGRHADVSSLYFECFLVSLAITASTAGAVALVGPAGALLGFAYFSFGIVISGASILPEFLPMGGRVAGQFLPPGAGTTAIRDTLYFPAAGITHPVTVLALYAVTGMTVVLGTNAIANFGWTAARWRRASDVIER